MSEAVNKTKELIASLNLASSSSWTIQDVLGKEDADKAAEIIRLVTNDEDFFPIKVGEKARTDASTAAKMLTLRNTLVSFEADEGNEDYRKFWREMKELNDYYFLQFVYDLYKMHDGLMDDVNRLRLEEKSTIQEEKEKKEKEQAEISTKKATLDEIAAGFESDTDYLVVVSNGKINQFDNVKDAESFINDLKFSEGEFGAILKRKVDGVYSVANRKIYEA